MIKKVVFFVFFCFYKFYLKSDRVINKRNSSTRNKNFDQSYFEFSLLRNLSRKLDSLENCINADLRKAYFDELQKLSQTNK